MRTFHFIGLMVLAGIVAVEVYLQAWAVAAFCSCMFLLNLKIAELAARKL